MYSELKAVILALGNDIEIRTKKNMLLSVASKHLHPLYS